MKIISLLTTATLFFASIAQAQETAKSKKPLSMKKVRVLSLLPINGPAFIYAKKPVTGVIVTVIEAGGLALGTYGAVKFSQKDNCTSANNFAGLCDVGNALGKVASTGYMGIGYGLVWLPAYITTAILSPKHARKYNESIVPIVSVTNNGALFGMAGRF